MFIPHPTHENVAKMKASIPTATGSQLVDFFGECCIAVSESWDKIGERTQWMLLANAAQKELETRLKTLEHIEALERKYG